MYTWEQLNEQEYWDIRKILGEGFIKGMTKDRMIGKILGGKKIEGGDKINYVDNPIEYLKDCHLDLNVGGVLTLETHTDIERAFSDPEIKNYFGGDYFTYFVSSHPNYRGIGSQRDYPCFKQIKQSFVGRIRKVELIK